QGKRGGRLRPRVLTAPSGLDRSPAKLGKHNWRKHRIPQVRPEATRRTKGKICTMPLRTGVANECWRLWLESSHISNLFPTGANPPVGEFKNISRGFSSAFLVSDLFV